MTVKTYLKKNRKFLVFVFVLFAFRWSFADHNRVPTGSMEPTIHIGDHIAINKMAFDLKLPFTDYVLTEVGTPKRGDILVFKYPLDESQTYVKRLVGLPGDHMIISDGHIILNGEPIPVIEGVEKWPGQDVQVQRNSVGDNFGTQEFVVPEGHYFFMGDKRDNSSDSRAWGFVPRKNIKGRAHFVLFNVKFDHFFPQSEILRTGKILE